MNSLCRNRNQVTVFMLDVSNFHILTSVRTGLGYSCSVPRSYLL